MEQPNKDWHEFHESTRYKLVMHLCLFFIVLMSIVGLVNFSNVYFSAAPNLLVVVMCSIGVFILKRTRNYRLVAKFISLLSICIVTGSFFLLKATHYLTPMWMIVNILFTFFILGKRWGISVLVVHFLVLFAYLWLKHTENIVAVKTFTTNDILTFTVEYSIVGFAIGYLLNLYIVDSRYSKKKMESTNQQLIEQNKIITKQNNEMEVMLREIHHRVKNNLQIITSLLRLQANRLNRESDVFYKEAINRVTAMAIIHERMYQSGSLSDFDLRSYLESLISSILANNTLYIIPKVDTQVNITNVSSKSIVPLALLINELVLNSLKHAFHEQRYPKIGIYLENEQGGKFQLIYSDNGTWVQNPVPSFGTEIIEAMTGQLEGNFELSIGEKGTKYIFELTNLS